MKQKWLDALDITNHEVEAQMIGAKHVKNPQQWLHYYREEVSKLSEGGKGKRAIESLLKGADKALAREDEELAKLCIVKIGYRMESAKIEDRRIRETTGGREGGRKPRPRPWPEVAAMLAKLAGDCTKPEAWELLPDSRGAWQIELNEYDAEVYRDGDYLIAVNDATRQQVGILKKTSFLKRFYPPKGH